MPLSLPATASPHLPPSLTNTRAIPTLQTEISSAETIFPTQIPFPVSCVGGEEISVLSPIIEGIEHNCPDTEILSL